MRYSTSPVVRCLRRTLRRVCQRVDPELGRFEFRIGDVFDPDDEMARYLVRLSIALGDLRIAGGTYLIREEQPMHERMYFGRLTAAHLHELGILFNRGDAAIPSIEDFIAAVVAPDDPATAQRLRDRHKEVQRALSAPVRVPGKPRLASELKRLRDDFLHYFNRAEHEPRLREAMERAADVESAYVIREHTMRAEYADEIGNKLMHPWPGLSDEEWNKALRSLHSRIRNIIKPVGDFLHLAEATYLDRWPPDVVRRIDLR